MIHFIHIIVHLLILSHDSLSSNMLFKIQTQKLLVFSFCVWSHFKQRVCVLFSAGFLFCKWFGVGYIFKHDVKPCVASSSTRGEQRPGHLEGTLHLLSAPLSNILPR